MIRTPVNCRQFFVRRWSHVTAEATAMPSIAAEGVRTTATARRGFRNLAVHTNSSLSYSNDQHPRKGQSPSQHYQAKHVFGSQNTTSGPNTIQVRTVFIQTENTPNPESIKFVPANTIVLDNEDGSGHFLSKTDAVEEILKSPLAKDLFKIDGVKAVYFGRDFVTVTKRVEAKWQFMRPEIFSCLMDFFENPNNIVLMDKPQITDTTILEDDDEIVAMIKELIEDRIRPAVQEDGGDIHYRDFEEDTGIVTVQLAGSCVGCPSSSITLKQGVENMLMHYIPEVTAVVAQEEEGAEGEEDSSSFGEEPKKQKSYEERLAAAGIPFSD
jgi:Fe-S cluster biogenesis protein NfuA